MKQVTASKTAKTINTKGTLRRLFCFMKPYRVRIVFMVVCLVLGAVFTTQGPYTLGRAMDALVAVVVDGTGALQGFQTFLTVLLQLGCVYLLAFLFNYTGQFIVAGVAERTMHDLRMAVDKKIRRLPLAYFDGNTFGDVLSRVTNDVDTIDTSLQQSISQVITAVCTMIFIFVMMLVVSPILTLIGVCVIPLCGFVSMKVVKHSQKYFQGQQTALGDLTGYVEEMYNGQNVIAAFGKEEDIIGNFEVINQRLYTNGWRAQFSSSIIMPLTQALTNIGYVGVAVVSGWLCINGRLSIGMIQSFIQYLRQFSQPINQISNIANIMQATMAAAQRVFEFLDAREEVPEAQVLQFPKKPEGNVDFNHVQFGYSDDQLLIHDLDLHVQSGDKIAIVGPTGAGKTTLVNLILRFYDVKGGSITIDGVDVRDMNREALRSMIGMVLQDTWLFSGTIKDNIRYGKLSATDEEVVQAAKAAHAHGFIMAMPGGYDMQLHEGASNIAQGQRQLLTIARAFLSDPEILILDEATSSVDTRTEVAIQKATNKLMEGRTSFVIAHRLSTIKDAQLIVYMEHGDIKEVGNHRELLARGGYYAALYNSQFAAENAG
ncbi:MAG: ABC transporter ATP-binding protein [Enterocloster asparagiformis]|nr:ABC transporter ATP-binding protein [Enterocloster asparagiformis]